MAVLYVIGHWTGGNHKPCSLDLASYQELIDYTGKLYMGGAQGKTASTGGMNSITYNISCCGGLDRSPMTKEQIEAFCVRVVKALTKYKLTEKSFYTHAEIGEMYVNKTITKLLPMNDKLHLNKHKIDLTILPYDVAKTPTATGNLLREKIRWYLLHPQD